VVISPDAFATVVVSGLFCIGVGGLTSSPCAANDSRTSTGSEKLCAQLLDQK